jgi:hypothetical protein
MPQNGFDFIYPKLDREVLFDIDIETSPGGSGECVGSKDEADDWRCS